MSDRLEGRRAIVTGAASGIGRASALLFAQQGAAVVVSDRDEAGLQETLAAIEASGGRALAVAAEASDAAAVEALVARCLAEFGGLEVMFANAGIGGSMRPVLELSTEDWTEVLDVNLIGPFLALKFAALHMREAGGGSILCTASVAGLRSGAGPTPYSAAKAGVISLVQTAAQQLGGTGIRVNALCPGLIETGLTQPLFDHARAKGREASIGLLNPTRRAGTPEEIANTALFLASDESSYVTGQAFAIDGGLSSSHPVVPGKLW
jgi:NAD(P)-dependent dehydrogenase (short-subunit alcohol dehydrogenase family)